jgi:hypothetical protein
MGGDFQVIELFDGRISTLCKVWVLVFVIVTGVESGIVMLKS